MCVCVYVYKGVSFFFFFLDGEGNGQMDVRFMGGKEEISFSLKSG